MSLGPPELLIILALVLVIFGGSKLPKLARSLGEAKKEFENSTSDKSSTTTVVEKKEVVVDRSDDDTTA